MNGLLRTFLKGLSAVLPTVLTLYLLWWLGSSFEAILGRAARWLLPEGWYVPGLGLAGGVILILLVGGLLDLWIVRRLGAALRHLMQRVPLVKSIYGALRDMMRFFGGDAQSDLGQPVMVTFDGKRLVGFITRHDAEHAFPGVPSDCVAVYLPMSYQLGGYVVMLPESELEPIDMPVEQAMRVVLTAGIGGDDDDEPPKDLQGS